MKRIVDGATPDADWRDAEVLYSINSTATAAAANWSWILGDLPPTSVTTEDCRKTQIFRRKNSEKPGDTELSINL